MSATPAQSLSTPVRGVMLGRSDHALWQVPAETRLRRAFGQIGLGAAGVVHADDAGQAADQVADLAAADTVLLARVDTLFEPRALAGLARQPGPALLRDAEGTAVAALAPAGRVAEAAAALLDGAGRDGAAVRAGFASITAADLDAHDQRLRRSAPPLVQRVRASDHDALEARLYGNAYKGVTDAITKWLWPRPSAWLVRHCARLSITPNQVTAIGFALVLIAGWLFAQGQFAAGLVAAWVMTLLDTVDGKLARVTVQSSRFGDHFDHGIDLVHPPFWYLAWGLGLNGSLAGLSTVELIAWIFIPYTGGRLTEGGFTLCCGGSLFMWRPFDSWFRLVTARRNPALVLLTLSVLLGRPDSGLLAVIGWAVISALIQAFRLAHAGVRRLRGASVGAWLAEPDAAVRHPFSYRTFAATRGAFRR